MCTCHVVCEGRCVCLKERKRGSGEKARASLCVCVYVRFCVCACVCDDRPQGYAESGVQTQGKRIERKKKKKD